MNRLAILLLRTYAGPFLITFLVAMFIFELQFVWLYLDELLGKDLGFLNIARLLTYVSARLVNMALPLAILMSSIMTLGALGEHNELTAMKTAGISLFRILRPLIVFSIIVSVTAFLFANNVWPIANLKFRTMLSAIMQQKPAFQLKDGAFYSGISGISIRVSRNDPETGELNDVLIYDHRDNSKGNRTVIRAKAGRMEQTSDKRFLFMTLYNGHSYDEQMDERKSKAVYAHVGGKFEKMILRMDLSSLMFKGNSEEIFKGSHEMMTVNQIDVALDSLEAQRDSARVRNRMATWKSMHYPWRPDARFRRPQAARDSIRNAHDALLSGGEMQDSLDQDSIARYPATTDSTGQPLAGDSTVLATDSTRLGQADSAEGSEPVESKPDDQDGLALPYHKGFFFDALAAKTKRRVLNAAQDISRRNKDMFIQLRDELDGRDKQLRRFRIEWHRKFYLAAICMVLFFIGSSLGAIVRKGGFGLPILMAIVLFVIYHLLTVSGERMAKSGILEAWQGMWLSTLILLPLAVWLTYKAANDSVLLDRDAYTRWFRKIMEKLKITEKKAVS